MSIDTTIRRLRRNPRGAAFEFEHQVADMLAQQQDHIAALAAERDALKEERDLLSLRLQHAAQEHVYEGNSAAHWISRAKARGDAIDRVFAAIRASGTPIDGRTDVAEYVKRLVAERDALRENLKALVAWADAKKPHGAPNHSHRLDGIWDIENSDGTAGTPCVECAMWDAARAARGRNHDE